MSEDTLPHSAIRIPRSDFRIGVVVCECGGEIAGRIDTLSLRRQVAALPGVVYAACETYPCSKDGQARLSQAIAEHDLERVLIAGCAPRLVEKLFQQAAQTAGLDSGCIDVADIREQCAYVHSGDPHAAARSAADLIAMGAARLAATSLPGIQTGRVAKSAVVVGGGLSGLAAALMLADNGIAVTLVEACGTLGIRQPDLADRAGELLTERAELVLRHPRIHTLLNARVSDVNGRPGSYEVSVSHSPRAMFDRAQTSVFEAGAIVVAAEACPERLGDRRWYDRSRVLTQAEFETELEAAAASGAALRGSARGSFHNNIVMILCAEDATGGRCSRVCCTAGIRQAIRARQINPDANVTVLFRQLYLGGLGDLHADELQAAQKLGVTFFRYQKDKPPSIGEKTVDVPDALTGEPLRVPFDRVVLSLPLEPPELASQLAALLRVPQDEYGFMIEPRVRLRPGRYADDGVFVLGGAHQPVDTAEELFQAYVTGSRVMRFLSQEMIRVDGPVAQVDSGLCTGDGRCTSVCPTAAITLVRDNVEDGASSHRRELSVARVEPLRCTGCGNCVVTCPVKAINLPGWEDAAILAQISVALQDRETGAPRVIAFACEWSAYAAADVAGARRAAYPAGVRIIRMPCSARFDPDHVLWAFINGADGVFLGACPPGECHYGAGNQFARERVETLEWQLAERGLDPRRLRLEFLPGDDGERFAQVMTEFVAAIKEQ